jgi:hypothetical protein
MASRRIEHLRPEFQRSLKAFLSALATRLPSGVTAIVSCTTRPREEQAELYALGRRAEGPKPHAHAANPFCELCLPSGIVHTVTGAAPGSTYHEYGLAADVNLFRYGKIIEDPGDPAYVIMGRLVDEAGLCWGGHWKRKDAPHVEMHPPGLGCRDAKKLSQGRMETA